MYNCVRLNLIVILLVSGSVIASGVPGWTQYGRDAARNSIAVDGPSVLDQTTLTWVASRDPWDPNYMITFEGPSSPVLFDGKVYAYAKYYDEYNEYTHNQIIAFDQSSGNVVWASLVDQASFDSWSSPAVDIKNSSILIGSGSKIHSIDAVTGVLHWTTVLEKEIVNASICIAEDLEHTRAFVTDYMGFGATGKLYCINLDPCNTANPYQPGQIVWSDTVGGTSGASPAYRKGTVYVATISDPNHAWSSGNPDPGGTILAYDAKTNKPRRLWKATSSQFEGFFGGLTVTKAGFVYAANYDFYSEEDNSALCKIDANDGCIIWIAQTERTDSIPIVVGELIFISGGIDGFGSRPKIEAYRDHGSTVEKLWETPASMIVGGWTHQPVYANGKLYIGAIPTGGEFFGAYSDLYIFDTTKTPSDQGFILSHFAGCGSSPAITHNSLYSIGPQGLYKFYQPSLLTDVVKDKEVNSLDLAAFADNWLFDVAIGVNRCDFDLDGRINLTDFSLLAGEWLHAIE